MLKSLLKFLNIQQMSMQPVLCGCLIVSENQNQNPVLSGIHIRTLWKSAAGAPSEKTPFYPDLLMQWQNSIPIGSL
jgi:hypothetical protein